MMKYKRVEKIFVQYSNSMTSKIRFSSTKKSSPSWLSFFIKTRFSQTWCLDTFWNRIFFLSFSDLSSCLHSEQWNSKSNKTTPYLMKPFNHLVKIDDRIELSHSELLWSCAMKFYFPFFMLLRENQSIISQHFHYVFYGIRYFIAPNMA